MIIKDSIVGLQPYISDTTARLDSPYLEILKQAARVDPRHEIVAHDYHVVHMMNLPQPFKL